MSTFAIGRFSPASRDYLQQISQAAPLELYQDPFVFLMDPANAVAASSKHAMGELGLELAPVIFRFHTTLNVYNPNTQRTEFAVVGKPLTEVSATEPFVPYFVWAVDPVRSTTVRSFLVSMTNALHADNYSLQVTPELVDASSAYGASYNPYVYAEATR